jgi:nitrate/nitrite transporter NarK
MDWSGAFIALGIGTAAVAIIWLWRTRRLDYAAVRASGAESAGWKTALLSRHVWVLTLSYGAIGYFQYLFFYWLHYYFEHVLKMGKMESRYATALPSLAMAFTMPIGGWLSDRFQTRYGPRAGRCLFAGAAMVAAAVFLWPGEATHAPLWSMVWFTAALGALGLSEAAFWQTAVELGGARGGTAAAIMNTGGNGIGLLAPVITPWVAGRFGWPWAIALGGLISIMGAICWLWIRPNKNEENTQ